MDEGDDTELGDRETQGLVAGDGGGGGQGKSREGSLGPGQLSEGQGRDIRQGGGRGAGGGGQKAGFKFDFDAAVWGPPSALSLQARGTGAEVPFGSRTGETVDV